MPKGFSFPNGAEMPASFQIPARTEIWSPLALPDNPTGPAYLLVIARMKPGLGAPQVRASMAVAAANLEKKFPQGKGWFNSVVVPLPEQIVGSTRPALWILWGAVGILLLIACANLTSLLLVRCAGRRREFSVRFALGAQQSHSLAAVDRRRRGARIFRWHDGFVLRVCADPRDPGSRVAISPAACRRGTRLARFCIFLPAVSRRRISAWMDGIARRSANVHQ